MPYSLSVFMASLFLAKGFAHIFSITYSYIHIKYKEAKI